MMSEQSTDQRRIQVAVLGGGCGAMAAALYLTSTAELREKYEVTVYQLGWRLGGKGATGRDPRKGYGDRVYEHGLHLWLGWYDNAFHVIQEVYAEWQKGPKNPFHTWTDAFQAQHFFTLQQDIPHPVGGVKWVTRNIPMPKLPGTPGYGPSPLSLIEYLDALIQWIERILHFPEFPNPRTDELSSVLASNPNPAHEATAASVASFVSAQGGAVAGSTTDHPFLASVRNALTRLKMALPWNHPDGTTRPAAPLTKEEHAATHGVSQFFLEAFQKWLHLEVVRSASMRDDLKWYWEALDFMTAIALGVFRDVLPNEPHGIASINHLDFCAWIGTHGADKSTQWSAFARTVYNLAFAFQSGIADKDHASFEAGTALMVYLRMGLGYKDAPMFRMRAGMGDTIFAPIYEVLKARRVKFEFFNKVTNLGLSKNRRLVETIALDEQARVKGGNQYSPLTPIQFQDGSELPCWPLEPRWDQLEDGEALKKRVEESGVALDSGWSKEVVGKRTLQRGVDFDHVVLGISVAGLETITPELSDAEPAWRNMLAQIATVETQAIQLWMKPELAELGWKSGPTIMATYQEPFDTWGEMSEVLKFENWQGDGSPQSLHYFCGPLEGPPEPPVDDPNYPKQAKAMVDATARKWLGSAIQHIWPDATDPANPAGLNYDLLVDPENRKGDARLAAQWLRANIDPSERYVCSFPGTSIDRLRSENSGFDNLFLAGDWTVSSVNGGCVEAAMESGMAASRAICGVPQVIPNYPPA